MDDAKIVELFFARSEDALSCCSRKYGRMLEKMAFNLLGTREDAEECLQDALHDAWCRIPPDAPEHLGAYLSKIVRRRAIDRFRRQHRQKREYDELLAELDETIPDAEDIDARLENERLAEALRSFLALLDEEKRVMFVRRYYFGESVAEVASAVGATQGKVKTTLSRVRAALGRYLAEEELL